jgi:hypothetical protein
MRSTATPLQQAYFTLLNGNVNVGGVIPIYDTVPVNPSYPYIQLSDRTANDFVTKSSFGEEVTQLVSIVDRFSGSFGSRIRINDVLDKVQQIVRARPVPISMAGFNTLTSTLDSAVFLRERTETHTYFRYEVRFRHLIEHVNS